MQPAAKAQAWRRLASTGLVVIRKRGMDFKRLWLQASEINSRFSLCASAALA
jgi:hypothetical protein